MGRRVDHRAAAAEHALAVWHKLSPAQRKEIRYTHSLHTDRTPPTYQALVRLGLMRMSTEEAWSLHRYAYSVTAWGAFVSEVGRHAEEEAGGA